MVIAVIPDERIFDSQVSFLAVGEDKEVLKKKALLVLEMHHIAHPLNLQPVIDTMGFLFSISGFVSGG